jgi:hypothetical protein
VSESDRLSSFVDYDEAEGYRVLAVEDELRDERRRLTRERAERRVRKAVREAKRGNNAVDRDTFRALAGFVYPSGQPGSKKYRAVIREGVLVWGKKSGITFILARKQGLKEAA